MQHLFRSAVAVVGLGLCSAVQAAGWYTGGEGVFVMPDKDRDADDGWGTRAFLGKSILDDKMALELAFAGYNTKRETDGGKNYFTSLMVDGLFPLGAQDGVFRPFSSLGFGAIQQNIANDKKIAPTAAVGAGALVRLTSNLFLRGDARYAAVFSGRDAGSAPQLDASLNLGVQSYFGGGKAAPAAACTDSDADGVCDDADLCPGTPAGTMVDAKGCPKEAPVVTPDEGPNRAYPTVHFDFDKSDIKPDDIATLDTTAATVNDLSNKYPSIKLDVAGHTDWIGTDGYNQGLSERRANAVKDYLVRKGVSTGRISTFAYGESRPVATNETEEGRAQNRRAELKSHAE